MCNKLIERKGHAIDKQSKGMKGHGMPNKERNGDNTGT